MKFIDEVRLQATSGAGGNGARAFRREKFVPRGGPSGGDGGKGGDVVFLATTDLNTLHHLRFTPIVKARAGGNGSSSHRTGKDAQDRVVRVPVGTVVRDSATGAVLADLDEDGVARAVLRGGRGGKGNAHFTTSTNRAPTRADPGEPGASADLLLELKLLADVGLLGFPNAGKSTLVSRISSARPRIAAYPFTTIEPQLGVVQVPGSYRTFVVADIPGLIEGASAGAGLGHRFLRHVERCRVLLHMVSLDPLEAGIHGEPEIRYEKLCSELAAHDPELARRPQVVLLSKLDLVDPSEVAQLRRRFEAKGVATLAASAATGVGMDDLVFALARALDRKEPA